MYLRRSLLARVVVWHLTIRAAAQPRATRMLDACGRDRRRPARGAHRRVSRHWPVCAAFAAGHHVLCGAFVSAPGILATVHPLAGSSATRATLRSVHVSHRPILEHSVFSEPLD